MQNNKNKSDDLFKSYPSMLQDNNNTIEIIKTNTNNSKNKYDSGYSSLITQRNTFIRATSPVVIPSNKTDSSVHSYNSRNSALINEEELEEMFSSPEKNFERPKDSSFYLLRDLDFNLDMSSIRHSVRSSPWTVRPDSAPLNEEDEDTGRESTDYSSSYPKDPQSMSKLPELIQCCTLQCNRTRLSSSTSESEQRNELIASKLREIADKLNTSKKVRTRHHSISSDSVQSTSNRHSRSSFAEVLPCCGSAVDLVLSLYSVYKSHSRMVSSNSTAVVNSQSTANITSQVKRRVNHRNRSHTQ